MHTTIHRKVSVLAIEHPLEAVVLRVLIVTLGLCLSAYLYLVAASVLNVIAQKEAVSDAVQLESSIGKLEQQYFTLSQDITPEAGTSIGLAPITQTSYVYRPGNVGLGYTTSNEI